MIYHNSGNVCLKLLSNLASCCQKAKKFGTVKNESREQNLLKSGLLNDKNCIQVAATKQP